MKLLYKPFAIIGSAIASRLGKATFHSIWSRIDVAEPPEPTTRNAALGKVVAAAALEAGVMSAVSAAVDRGSARVFYHLTGFWPGEKQPERE
jgi:Protein of unknown function (DUF4235)